MEITHDYFLEKFSRKRKINQKNKNEFILAEDDRTGQQFLLIIRYTDELKKDLKAISKKIKLGYREAEKQIIQFAIVFSPKYIVFLRLKPGILGKTTIQQLKKQKKKLDYPFKKKIKKIIKSPESFGNWDVLWDRSDLIDEFYKLYSKAKDRLYSNVQGINDDQEKMKFVDTLLMQLLIIWYLQKKRFLDNDKKYLIKKFHDFEKLGYDNYYAFLKDLFKIMMGESDIISSIDSAEFGDIIVTGPAPFINGKLFNAQISDDVFYIKGTTEILLKSDPNKVSEVPVLNLFESRDWTEGNIDEYVLGAIYEKLMTQDERKKTGAFYTPEEVTRYICEATIFPFLLNNVNRKFEKNFSKIDELFEKANSDILIFLFQRLKTLKIVDPAVGSAHFLETAIEVLLEVYERIYKCAKSNEIKNGLNIIASEKEEIKKLNLLRINEINQFRLYIKFYIILSRNIYGVDINPSALNVSKARLFLSLAKHFEYEKAHFIRFPNIHFNLRYGNSLLGYIRLDKDKGGKQFSLDSFIDDKRQKEINKSIRIVESLSSFISEISKKLELKGSLSEEISELNNFLVKENLNEEDIRFILSVKERLIKILIISLNSKYAIPINNLLNQITHLFTLKLDKKYSEKLKIDKKDLDKIGPFHWIFEFPEAFLNRDGFDIVIGNPPYLSSKEIPNYVKKYFKKLYSTASRQYDLYSLFIERSLKILSFGGYFGFIISDSFLGRSSFEPIRSYLLDRVSMKSIDRLKGVFEDPSVSNAIITFNNVSPTNNKILFRKWDSFQDFLDNQEDLAIIPQKFFHSTYRKAFRFIKEDSRKILEKLAKNSIKFGTIIDIHRGEELGKKSKKIQSVSKNNYRLLFGEDVSRYSIKFSENYIKKSDVKKDQEMYFSPKILIRQLGDQLNVVLDSEGRYVTLQTIYNIRILDENFKLNYLLGVLNSKLIDFYYTLLFKKELFPRILLENIEDFPIVLGSPSDQKILMNYVDELLVLTKLKERITKFSTNSFDNLVNDKKLLINIIEDEDCDIIETIRYHFKEDNLLNRKFSDFFIRLFSEKTLKVYGTTGSKRSLLAEIEIKSIKYRDIIYFDIIKTLGSRKLIETLKDLFLKTEISIISPKKWPTDKSITELLDKKASTKKGKSTNLAYTNRRIRELEDLINALVFKIYNIKTKEIKTILNTSGHTNEEVKQVLTKYENVKET